MVFFACIPHSANFIIKYFELDASIRYVFYNSYMALELLFLSIFFSSYFISKYIKYIFQFSILLCSVIGLIFIVYYGFTTFLSQWLCFNNVAYSFWTLLLLYELYDRDEMIYDKSLLFYLFGLFFYTSCTILAFGLWDYMSVNENSSAQYLKVIHTIFNVTKYVSLSIGFILETKQNNLKTYEK